MPTLSLLANSSMALLDTMRSSPAASINTGTRNDYGRLGPREAEIYLGSPFTVAASAVAGKIVDPREFL